MSGADLSLAGWTEREITLHLLRAQAGAALGMPADQAEALAVRLLARDRGADDRRSCVECIGMAGLYRCTKAAEGALPGSGRRAGPMPSVLQRCEGFELRPVLHAFEIAQQDAPAQPAGGATEPAAPCLEGAQQGDLFEALAGGDEKLETQFLGTDRLEAFFDEQKSTPLGVQPAPPSPEGQKGLSVSDEEQTEAIREISRDFMHSARFMFEALMEMHDSQTLLQVANASERGAELALTVTYPATNKPSITLRVREAGRPDQEISRIEYVGESGPN